MKKLILLLLSFMICFIFISCTDNNDYTTSPDDDTTTTENLIATPEIMESTVIDSENLTRTNDMIVKGTPDENSKSGLSPLPEISYKASDPHNQRGLSTKKISHSHGPASDGKAHHTVAEMQKFMEKYQAFTVDMSGEKVLYLTFDCGYEYENLTSRVLDTLKKKGLRQHSSVHSTI